jgi:hypothetical protein
MFSFTGSGTFPSAASVALREGGRREEEEEGGVRVGKALSQGVVRAAAASSAGVRGSRKETVVVEGLPGVMTLLRPRPLAPPLVLARAAVATVAAVASCPTKVAMAPKRDWNLLLISSRREEGELALLLLLLPEAFLLLLL